MTDRGTAPVVTGDMLKLGNVDLDGARRVAVITINKGLALPQTVELPFSGLKQIVAAILNMEVGAEVERAAKVLSQQVNGGQHG